MALTVTTLLKEATVPVAEALEVPLIIPTAPPPYQPPVSEPIPPDPATAESPVGQFRGEGGTPFGLVPDLYIQRPPIEVVSGESIGADYTPPPTDMFRWTGAVERLPTTQRRAGDASVMPVPVGLKPAKLPVGEALPAVTPPGGPITGKVLGFELSTIPLWVWLGVAALVGARVLK